MFKAFIADDDVLAVENIYISFDWKRLGVSDVVKIYNPHALADKIMSERPHIVFIDIEMYEVFGLDIVENCKSRGSNAIFVIVSGHDNFKYAQAAVNLGVIYYMLKPLEPSDIEIVTQKLRKASEIFNPEDSMPDDINSYFSNNAEFKKYLESDASLKLPNKYRFIAGIMSGYEYNDMKMYLEDSLKSSYKIGKNKYLFIVEEGKQIENLKLLLKNFAATKKITIAIGIPFDANHNIYENFKRTNNLSYGFFIDKNRHIFTDERINVNVLKSFIDKLLNLIDSKNFPKIKETLLLVPGFFIIHHFNMSQAVLLYNSITVRINIATYNHNRKNTLPPMTEEDLVSEYGTLENMCNCLYAHFRDVFQYTKNDEAPDNSEELLWEKYLSYINENYQRKIVIQDLCKELYVGHTFFYDFIKRRSGKTFVE
ncbi:MAG: response regulator, partial [Clostridiaceae bacterium]|nr:response regulator [Clostridiaceae bacterium]